MVQRSSFFYNLRVLVYCSVHDITQSSVLIIMHVMPYDIRYQFFHIDDIVHLGIISFETLETQQSTVGCLSALCI